VRVDLVVGSLLVGGSETSWMLHERATPGRARLGPEGRERARRFDWSECCGDRERLGETLRSRA